MCGCVAGRSRGRGGPRRSTSRRAPPLDRPHGTSGRDGGGGGRGGRLLALDLDGTLLTRDKRISPRTRRALDAAAARGCAIVIATGRGIAVLRRFCGDLPLQAPQITYNGAVIVDPRGDEPLRQYLVPPARVEAAVDFFLDAAVPVAFFTPDALYLDERIRDVEDWTPPPLAAPIVVSDVRAAIGRPCVKIVGTAEADTIARLRPHAVARFGEALYVTQTAVDLLEFLHPDVSKGAALRLVAARLGVARADVVAFGDSHNDRDMLVFAGTGVAMGNAMPEVKAVADLVTGSNDEDGIGAALETLGII